MELGAGRHVKSGTVTLPWADGEYQFRLGIGEWQELFRKTGAGPLELYHRVRDGKWRVEDLRETIRNGLIGAGMVPKDAVPLIKRYVDDLPLTHSVETVIAILLSGLLGIPGDEAPKKAAAEETGASLSASSTKPAPPSVLRRAKSTT